MCGKALLTVTAGSLWVHGCALARVYLHLPQPVSLVLSQDSLEVVKAA